MATDQLSPTASTAAAGRQIGACALALFVTASALTLVMGPLAYWYYSWAGVWAVLAAGGLCGLSGMLAFSVGRLCAERGQSLSGMLAAMAVRMGIPLAVCLILAIRGNAHSLAGFVYYLLIFYVATLAVETWYSLPSVRPARPATRRD